MNTITRIDVKELKYIKFHKDEVLLDENEKQQRKQRLEGASLLGNQYRENSRITFMDKYGDTYQVDAPVAALTTNHAILLYGLSIPIKSICLVD